MTLDGSGSVEVRAREDAAAHGRRFAGAMPFDVPGRIRRVRLDLAAARRSLTTATATGTPTVRAAQWLVENRHVTRQALRQVEHSLPRGYHRQLPCVSTDTGGVVPRAEAVARAIVTCCGGQADTDSARRFVRAYQDAIPLSLGELWALPAYLRLCILEDTAAAASATDALAGEESVAAGIVNLRGLETTDWTAFVESVSRVHEVLRGDPADAYRRMDFATRDTYRRAVEELSRWSRLPEAEVARAAVDQAAAAPRGGSDGRASHVGHYLIGTARRAFEAHLGARAPLRSRLARLPESVALAAYLGGIAAFTVAGQAAAHALLAVRGADGGHHAGVALLLCVPLVTAAVSAMNWIVTHTLAPRTLPKLDYGDGIPDDCRTVVVVPALLTNRRDAEDLARQIETAFLGNTDSALRFALLTDLGDATAESTPGDDALVAAAREAVEALNVRHGAGGRRPFGLFHRHRLWNPGEGCWMGWERKRGKLAEFNRMLLGANDTGFEVVVGFPGRPLGVRYVITIDADTTLPPLAARRLVATLDHPLNRPLFDPATGRVTDGYTILQPRVETSPETAGQTLFSRIASGDRGLDLYTSAVSDVYQDLLGDAVFTGKGAYDVHAFERSTASRVPANALLSHDLFEGVHGRVALLSDVVLFEDYPAHVLASMQRLHRWVRGDWQLVPWLARRVPALGGAIVANQLNVLGLWKIADNLRRSLLAPSLVLLLVAGWTWLPEPGTWTAVALAILGAPVAYASLSAASRRVVGTSWNEFAVGGARRVGDDVARWLLAVVFLLYETLVTLDAIFRTLVRVFVTRRRLLQWRSAAHVARMFDRGASRPAVWRAMAGGVAIAVVLAVLVVVVAPRALPVSLPVLVAWAAAPEVAFLVSRPRSSRRVAPTEAERRALRLLARRTWLYFERFAGPDDHWLPPDNVQESPGGGVAHRTSPTNVGMALLATVSAHDLGHLGLLEMSGRLDRAFAALDRLERHRGHFLNWYGTRDLRPLEPRYVSTVDSGNLAGCLIAVAQACRDAVAAPVPSPSLGAGIEDTTLVLAAALRRTPTGALDGLASRAAALVMQLPAPVSSAGSVLAALEGIEGGVAALERELLGVLRAGTCRLDASEIADIRTWFDRVRHLVRARHAEVATLCAWSTRDGMPRGPVPLREIPALCRSLRERSGAAAPGEEPPVDPARVPALDTSAAEAERVVRDLEGLAARAEAMVAAMDFGMLYDPSRKLLRIGYDVSAGDPDRNHYDLLASEARLASFLAIAKGDVPVAHWLHLGRPLTRLAGEAVLLSWGGSMFEYLMPGLLLRVPERTLLARSCRNAAEEQRRFAEAQDVPWGMSESAYHRVDAHGTYRYRSFGVPGLGLAPEVGERLVVAPYASVLALPFLAVEVLSNLERLERLGALGRYGMYEAVDFGTQTQPSGGARIVRCFMAHHQGMILCAAANRALGEIHVRRFHGDARVAAVAFLLHERVPPPASAPRPEAPEPAPPPHTGGPVRVPAWTADTAASDAHVLGNGRLAVLVTSTGGGHSRLLDHDLTRWRCDPTLGGTGTWIYLRDVESGALWSAAPEPRPEGATEVETRFAAHDASFRRRDHGISARMEIVVAPHEDVELRRITLLNDTDRPRRVGVTSFAEVALAARAEDLRHPAFVKLFVESRWVPESGALVFRRRPRSPDDHAPHLAHAVFAGLLTGGPRWETDRARFLGRGGSARRPAALMGGGAALSGATGSTLDPVACLDVEVVIEAHGRVEVAFVTAAAETEARALALVDAYRSPARIAWAFEQARIASEHLLFEIGIGPGDVPRAQRTLSPLHLPRGTPRPDRHGSAPGPMRPRLWAHGISGELPILLVMVADDSDRGLVSETLRAHAWSRRRGAACDVVVIDDVSTGYASLAQEWLRAEVEGAEAHEFPARTGQVFVLRGESLPAADRSALVAAAGAVVHSPESAPDRGGALARSLPWFVPVSSRPAGAVPPTRSVDRPAGLVFDNGLGGFTKDGREYVIHLDEGRVTPAPWANVVANASFGFLASESGGGFTWCGNSGENRLTPWANDPVTDRPGEVVYLRDEETAEVWSSTPSPAPGGGAYQVRHGADHTEFLHRSHGLDQRLELFVDPDAPVKILRLTLGELDGRARRITITCYVEWVLGTTREASQEHLVPEYDGASGTLLVRNPWSDEFADRVAFLAASRTPHGLTADRREFLGPLGEMRTPAALARVGLAGTVEAGRDICGALQVHVDLPAGATTTLHFVLGQGDDREHALALAQRFRDPAAVAASRTAGERHWDDVLSAISVRTPDPAIDLLLGRWLLHQTLACRVWGRTGLYQSSGAFGFRDQLQDVLALCHAAPSVARAHLLDAASRQFPEGDVLHWWHPPRGRGVRTRCSDDLLWLPYAVAAYVEATGDQAVLDEPVPFLRGPTLADKEAERYGAWEVSDERAPLLDHCLRAVARADTAGPHGLPLMGAGDWNDGMNRVGALGIGESVWLAWFLRAVLLDFAPLCERREDRDGARRMRDRADELREAVGRSAWDGEWYVRAFHDDGTPLGSAHGPDSRIDSVAQAWAVLSGGAADDRARRAMESVWRRLVDQGLGLVRLLDPPFHAGESDPGYIRAYPPGTRENGAQYTHAAVWTAWAFAALGDADRAARILDCLHPLRRCSSAEGAAAYGGEPYVIAGDIHAEPPRAGRAGWTWYTGAAGWTYRFVLEAVLGIVVRGGRLRLAPSMPRSWSGFEAEIRRGAARYRIRVERGGDDERGTVWSLDGAPARGGEIELVDDGSVHEVFVRARAPAEERR